LKRLSGKELKVLGDKIALNIVPVLAHFGIEVQIFDDYVTCPCPIHGGDCPTGWTMTTDADNPYLGIWVCWTEHCEQEIDKTTGKKKYVNNPIGLIRALLSNKYDREDIPFTDAVSFAMKLVETNFEDLNKGSSKVDFTKKSLSNAERNFKRREQNKKLGHPRNKVRQSLLRPAKYFLNRGYSEEVLDAFDVGVSRNTKGVMRKRVIVPVYDDEGEVMVGYLGRWPSEEYEDYEQPKWRFSKKFYSGAWLYGYHIAKGYIEDTKIVVLVEGQGDVWRLWESGIKNSVGMFGCSITDTQLRILENSAAEKIALICDNDKAGQKARISIRKKCEGKLEVVDIMIESKDIGEMSTTEIEQKIKPQIEGLYND